MRESERLREKDGERQSEKGRKRERKKEREREREREKEREGKRDLPLPVRNTHQNVFEYLPAKLFLTNFPTKTIYKYVFQMNELEFVKNIVSSELFNAVRHIFCGVCRTLDISLVPFYLTGYLRVSALGGAANETPISTPGIFSNSHKTSAYATSSRTVITVMFFCTTQS